MSIIATGRFFTSREVTISHKQTTLNGGPICYNIEITKALRRNHWQSHRAGSTGSISDIRNGNHCEHPGLGSVCNFAGAAASRQKQCGQMSNRCHMVPRHAETRASQPDMSEDNDSVAPSSSPECRGVLKCWNNNNNHSMAAFVQRHFGRVVKASAC